ncbi:MAG: hypothetical protein KA170_10635 [Candidatus Promineofilum sp.]|jgi:hypothetical protein|nr:hypothetical protein [Promineifilum sp.]
MGRVKWGLLGGMLGGVIGFALTALSFVGMALLDGARAGEAVGFGLAVGVAGGAMGGLIGLAVGALALGPLGGALAGVAATLAAVILYVFIFGNPDRLGYFLRESGVVVLVLGLPAMLTGSLTALIVRKGSRQ